MNGTTFRVVYGEKTLHFKDFSNISCVLSFVRRLLRKHPGWKIGDSWRDEISVCEFFWNEDVCRDTRHCSEFVLSVLSSGNAESDRG